MSYMMENPIIIKLHERIDSDNAKAVERELIAQLPEEGDREIVLDAKDLHYISSAGLRVLLHIRKSFPSCSIIGVNSEIYEIFDMTGFTEMFRVKRAYRHISVEGCEEIDSGTNGSIFRIDKDNIVKVFTGNTSLEKILHEREMARMALILGIPTAISYDVVMVGENYGSVFEMLDAITFSKILANDPAMLERCVDESVRLLRQIHETVVPAGKLPDVKTDMLQKLDLLDDYLPHSACKKLREMINAVPYSDHMLHGDYHTKNIMRMGDEVLLIDMETLATGHPVFEMSKMFNAYLGFSEIDHEHVKKFQGFDRDLAAAFWQRSLEEYFQTDDKTFLKDVEDKAAIIGYMRILHFMFSRGEHLSKDGKKSCDHWRSRIIDLLGQYDTLVFDTEYHK